MNTLNTCLRKKQYTEAAARSAAATLRRRKRFGAVVAYPCRMGGELHWHIGHSKRR